jgi:hypothetical protein
MATQERLEELDAIIKTETFTFVRQLIEDRPEVFRSEEGLMNGLFHMTFTIINAIDSGKITFKTPDIKSVNLALLALVLKHVESVCELNVIEQQKRKLDS